MNPIKFSLRHPTVTLVLTAMVVVVGVHAFMDMPRTEDPTITIRTGMVAALYPGATSEQVEKQVTKTLEKHIFKFQEVRKDKTYSTSRPGLVIINVELENNVKNPDIFWAKLRHEMNVVRATELPDGVQGPVVDSDFGDTVAMLIAVHGERYGYRELRDYVDTIQDELRTVPRSGQARHLRRAERADLDDRRPGAHVAVLRRPVPGGHGPAAAKRDPERGEIRRRGFEDAASHHGDVQHGRPDQERARRRLEGRHAGLHQRFRRRWKRRYQDPDFMVRYDGKPCLLLSVEMQKGKNIVEIGEKLEKVLTRLKLLLPPDLQIDFIANQPEVVKERIAH